MKKIMYIVVALLLIVATFAIGGCSQNSSDIAISDEFSSKSVSTYATPREHAEFTDGVVTATFDKEAETLIFSGNGAVDGGLWWLEGFKREERVFVRTIVFEDGITSIGSVEFSDNRGYINLEKVIFRGDINAIDSCAFSSNRNLTTVEFGGGCKAIEDLAFFQCSSLENINVPEGCRVDSDAFNSTPFDRDEDESEEVATDYSRKEFSVPPPSDMPPVVEDLNASSAVKDLNHP